jgi:hypothetical protein
MGREQERVGGREQVGAASGQGKPPLILDVVEYQVHCFSNFHHPLAVGKDNPSSKRSLFAINAMILVRQAA